MRCGGFVVRQKALNAGDKYSVKSSFGLSFQTVLPRKLQLHDFFVAFGLGHGIEGK